MKIDRITSIDNKNIYEKYRIASKNNTEKIKQDSFQLSNEAKNFLSISKEISEGIVSDKVRTIKKAINDGTYKINNESLAESIFNTMKGSKI
ncbi:flagellar biosynthesis anti-sigma factor FlgM [Clostridium cellulovorans]|uniref:Negative regulator of flagellin synthesis n=1 Tax=Clostridium cellulovorans (strain ATCC 35296 / DSM 3052 / OCM 3 / 743B) TaxID=573061 RepID=D9SKE7_CLOC7|nr:flagellar biosynthesis anti-sigma factor FlgM [Clostridium cellulovorans]ADL51443.1 Anti-sigma-28 factor FlgM family protein [Clostridium cellulovorans 743B]